MKKVLLIIISCLIFSCSTGQNRDEIYSSIDSLTTLEDVKPKFILTESYKCEQDKLSNQFDISIDFKRYVDTIEIAQNCYIKVEIRDKSTEAILDSFTVESNFIFSFMFLSCDSMTSYTTKFNADREIYDNYFGDVVVADFNFDGYDDIAIVNDSGGNGGPSYSFYLQNKSRKFTKDNFLTDTVSYFPSIINKKDFTLTTYGHAGVCGTCERIYKLYKNTWKKKSHKIINICE
jgi:hypothetical protein